MIRYSDTESVKYYINSTNRVNRNNINLVKTVKPETPKSEDKWDAFHWKRTSDDVNVEVDWCEDNNEFIVMTDDDIYSCKYFEFFQQHTFRKNRKLFEADGKPEIGYILILNAMRLIHLAEQRGGQMIKIDKNKAIESYVAERFDDLKYAVKNSDVDFLEENIKECLSH